ncbi:MAG: hypothetical protein K2U26_08285 [Cyclobacteriaceae bacterium]|nr:hypothetical protein [Cyclobacteriaceae bacterium]
MKKLISLSIFIAMVVLALLAHNTAEAQATRPVAATHVLLRPTCPGPSYVWARGGRMMRLRFHRHFGYGPHWYARPVRVKRHRW